MYSTVPSSRADGLSLTTCCPGLPVLTHIDEPIHVPIIHHYYASYITSFSRYVLRGRVAICGAPMDRHATTTAERASFLARYPGYNADIEQFRRERMRQMDADGAIVYLD